MTLYQFSNIVPDELMTQIQRIEVPIPLLANWVNCYYIDDSRPTLIDSGVNTDEGLDAIRSVLAESGKGLDDLRRIIVTHGHMDHAGLAGRLAETSSAELFIHPWDVNTVTGPGPRLWQRARIFREFLGEAGVPEALGAELIDPITLRYKSNFSAFSRYIPLKGGDVFSFDDFSLEVIHTPGHSSGSVCLLDRENGTLFSGDTLLEEVTCNPATDETEAEQIRTDQILSACRNSLELIEDLPVKRVLPGHGLPFSKHRKRIRRILDHHQRRRAEILRVLDELAHVHDKAGGVTQYMLAQRLFPPMTGVEYYHRCCAVRVHLEALAREGLVERHKEIGPIVYWPR